MDPDQQPDALSQGRRIYIGNLLYSIKPIDIEEMLVASGFGDFENIHISIDPVSARNPGYCFVDFVDKPTADRALSSLAATIRGRELKIGPCEPKKKVSYEDRQKVFRRWGDWNTDKASNVNSRDGGSEQGPRGALAHFDGMMQNFYGRRLYVGGLTRMFDQEQNHEEMRDIFAGFNPTAIGKRITPYEGTRLMPGHHHFCFVDFETPREAEAAVKALNGAPYEGGFLRVNLAKCTAEQSARRRSAFRASARGEDGRERNNERGGERGSPGQRPSRPLSGQGAARAMASNDWRRKVSMLSVE